MPLVLLTLLATSAPADATAPPPQVQAVHTDPGHGGSPLPRPFPLSPGALWDFAQIGAGVFVEVTRDNPVLFSTIAAGLTLAGTLGGAAACGGLGVAVAIALSSAGVLTGWPLVLVVVVPVALGTLTGAAVGLSAGLGTGFWASVDEGELSLAF